MKRRNLLFIALCAALLAAPVCALADAAIAQGSTSGLVNQVQQRLIDLDYYSFKPTATYGGMSRTAAAHFQELHKLTADGSIGDESLSLLFSNTALKNAIPQKVEIPIGPQTKTKPAEFGEALEWVEVDAMFPVGGTITLLDLNTQKTLSVTRTGGSNHAVIETANKADTDVFLEIFGGVYNWSKRPVTALINGKSCAASLQGMPSGKDSVEGNGMEGGCALYFTGSTSDISGLPDEEHRRVLLKAAGTRW